MDCGIFVTTGSFAQSFKEKCLEGMALGWACLLSWILRQIVLHSVRRYSAYCNCRRLYRQNDSGEWVGLLLQSRLQRNFVFRRTRGTHLSFTAVSPLLLNWNHST